MKNKVKIMLRSFVPFIILNPLKKQLGKVQFKEWKKNNCPVPPPNIVKEITIQEYQQKYGLMTLIETGTFMGDMVEAQKTRFHKIISIELDLKLFAKALKRFKNNRNVTILQGDSGNMLPKVLKEINDPALFWLDGHYSGGITAKGDKECPIFEELDAIFSSKKLNHVLLIDDARHFIGKGDYPTIDKLTEFIRSKNKEYQVEVKHDIIRYTI